MTPPETPSRCGRREGRETPAAGAARTLARRLPMPVRRALVSLVDTIGGRRGGHHGGPR